MGSSSVKSWLVPLAHALVCPQMILELVDVDMGAVYYQDKQATPALVNMLEVADLMVVPLDRGR